MLANHLKRFCAMLVAVVMLLTCMPLSALAETDENVTPQNTETPQDEAPAAQPVASVEIPVAVETVVDKAEKTMSEVAQSQQATTEELENKLDSVGDAEAAVEDLEDLTDAAEGKVDDLEAAIPNVQDAVNKETVTEAQGKEALEAQHAETEAALNAAKKQQEEAAAALELAKQEYEAAKTQSEEAQAAAMKKLLAAQEELEMAEQRTAVAKQTVDAIAETLNNIQDTVNQAQENNGTLLEDLKAGLEESKEDLKVSVENLNQTTDEIKENTETLITELENLQASAEKFEESVVTAKTTEEKALDMRAEYEEAVKALAAAQAAYDALIAEGGNVSDDDLKMLNDAIDAAQRLVNEMKADTEVYENTAYEKNLQILGSDATTEEKATAAHAVAGTLVGKLANGQKVDWVEGGEDSEYGKSENGFYVVLDSDGKVVGRYGYEVDGSVLNVYAMKSNGITYFIGTGDDITEVTKEVKDEDGQLKHSFSINDTYYYKDEDKYYYDEPADSTPHSDPVEVKFKEIDEKLVEAAVKAILGKDYGISEPTKQADGTYTFEVSYFVKEQVGWQEKVVWGVSIKTPVYEDISKTATFVIDSDNKITATGDNALAEYVGILFDLETDDYDTIGDYRVLSDKNGLYYIDGDSNRININKNEKGYYYKRDANFHEDDTSALTFTMGAVSKSDSAAQMEAAIAELNNANTALSQAQGNYDAAAKQYEQLQAELDKMADAKAKDLEVVTPGFSIGGIEFIPGKTAGNLADLPVSIDELVNIEDFQDSEKREDLLEAMQNIGSGGISSMTALYQLVGLDAEDISALLAAETAGTDFQKEYAAAWVAALTAKVNVVISGFELVDQAGKTMEAGKELLASGAEIDDKILDAAQNAAKVAGYTGAIGAVQLGDNAFELTDQILSKLESKVAYLQMEANAAAMEVNAAKAALDEMIQNCHDPYALMLQEAKARLDQAESKYNALVKDLDQAYAELDVAYAKIGTISAPQKSAESEKRAGTFVLDETRFQMKDTNNKVLHFPYTLKGNTLVLTVTETKSVIVIEVAYMAELVNQGIQVVEFKTANGTYVLNMAAFLKANPTVEGTVEVSLEAATYSFVLNGKTVTEKLELKK